ncbi:MAG: hypothetical protein ACKVOR_04135 [Flavobacteriales bacterium]
MKQLILFAALLFSTSSAMAQYPLAKGEKQVNFGFGFSGLGLPVYAGLDFGVHEDISVGAEFSYRSYNNSYVGKKYHHSIIAIAGTANYHFNSLLEMPADEWDIYAGINIGFYIWNSPSDYDVAGDVSGLGLGGQLGLRYYFKPNMGINLELGGSTAASSGKIGLSIKF